MQTTIQLPDAVYREGERLAQAKQELSLEEPISRPEARVSLPLIHSKQPGTLDLKDFNFDDLLA